MALPPDEEGNVDPGVFKEALVLTNTELSILLRSVIQDKTAVNPAYQPPALVKKTKEYVDKFGSNKNEENMRMIRTILAGKGFKQFEIGIIANLMPETYEEAATVLPSLKDPLRFPNAEEEIQDVLDEIKQYQFFQ